MKMIDQTLIDLWKTKDDIAKEHRYDLDALVAYLQSKSKSSDANTFRDVQIKRPKHTAAAETKSIRIFADVKIHATFGSEQIFAHRHDKAGSGRKRFTAENAWRSSKRC